MADPRFFRRAGPFVLGDIARSVGGTCAEDAAGRQILDVAGLDTAGPDELTFVESAKHRAALREAKAGAVLVTVALSSDVPAGTAAVIVDRPQLAFARIAAQFYPPCADAGSIAPAAHVDPSAELADNVSVGPGAVVGAAAVIGEGTSIGPGAVIGAGVVIGPGGVIEAGAVISHSIIGARVHVKPGARIGQNGFGFVPDPRGHVRIPQLGRVMIGDDVEIGANSTVDRGALGDTVIGTGSMIDNLVQIGHNVRLGRGCVIVAQVGISGSTQLGDFVMLGGQAGVAGHLKVGAGARVAAQAGVMRDIPDGGEVGGSPAMPARQWHRQTAALGRLAQRKSE